MDPEYIEILCEYNVPIWDHNIVFEKHKAWLKESGENGILKANLLLTLEKLSNEIEINIFEFVLLAIQSLKMDFDADDEHFDYLFELTNELLDSSDNEWPTVEIFWCVHLLMDICFHRPSDYYSGTIKRQPDLIPNVLEKIGLINYESNSSGEGQLAVYKAISILYDVQKERALQILNSAYLNHFDSSIRTDALKMYDLIQKKK